MLTNLAIPAAAAVLPARDYPGALLSNGTLSELMARLAAETGLDFPACSPEFPAERAGIHERGVLEESLSTRDMATEAARRAMALAEQCVEEVRCVIVSSVTPDMTFPALSTTVHAHLGCRPDAVAFDVSIGCNGFLIAIDLAAKHLEGTPVGSAAVVVASETMVRVADATNRTTLPLFGDGAGAIVLRKVREGRLRSVRVTTLGDCGPRIVLRANDSAEPIHRIVARDGSVTTATEGVTRHCIELEGKRVFRDMVRTLPDFVLSYLDEEHVRLADIDRFLFHQANARMIEAVAGPTGLALRPERVLTNIARVGNTASASIPILLAQAARDGELRRGDLALLCGFGSGYSIGALLLEW